MKFVRLMKVFFYRMGGETMSKKPLFIIIIVLLVTNVFTVIVLSKKDSSLNGEVILDNEEKIAKKEPVASINGEEVYYEDWMTLLRRAYGKQHLKKLIDHSVVEQLAKKNDIRIEEKLIDHGVALLTTMQGVLEQEEFDALEEKWRGDLLYRHQLEELLTEQEEVSEQDIQQHYNQYQKQYDFTAAIQFSHMIVENMEEAEKVIKELEGNASFRLLAMEYSIDEETKDDGGYLGYFAKTSQFLPTSYYDVAKDMDEGTYSEPLQTDQGVAIIYVHRKVPEINFTYEEIKDEIRREIALNRSEQTLTADQLWENMDIDWIYDPQRE